MEAAKWHRDTKKRYSLIGSKYVNCGHVNLAGLPFCRECEDISKRAQSKVKIIEDAAGIISR